MYKILPESGCNSGLAYPFVNVKVLPPAKVTFSDAVEDGVATALEFAPVIWFAPLNATYLFTVPDELLVP